MVSALKNNDLSLLIEPPRTSSERCARGDSTDNDYLHGFTLATGGPGRDGL